MPALTVLGLNGCKISGAEIAKFSLACPNVQSIRVCTGRKYLVMMLSEF